MRPVHFIKERNISTLPYTLKVNVRRSRNRLPEKLEWSSLRTRECESHLRWVMSKLKIVIDRNNSEYRVNSPCIDIPIKQVICKTTSEMLCLSRVSLLNLGFSIS